MDYFSIAIVDYFSIGIYSDMVDSATVVVPESLAVVATWINRMVV